MEKYRDHGWGCDHHGMSSLDIDNVRVCLVRVHELRSLAAELAAVVMNDSWMLALDRNTRRAYERTVSDTANALVEIFNKANPDSSITEEFGELMISMGSARALEHIFGHRSIPLAELWKPQLKQNEGFDFHTECETPLINFGEAKYSGGRSPHGQALRQIDRFLEDQKHLRDYIHLNNLCSKASIDNLSEDMFGVVAAFSVNAKNTDSVLENARNSAIEVAKKHGVSQVFVVGVIYESE